MSKKRVRHPLIRRPVGDKSGCLRLISVPKWVSQMDQRPFDPGLFYFTEEVMKTTVITILTRGLLEPTCLIS
jgi:hypothetical protein